MVRAALIGLTTSLVLAAPAQAGRLTVDDVRATSVDVAWDLANDLADALVDQASDDEPANVETDANVHDCYLTTKRRGSCAVSVTGTGGAWCEYRVVVKRDRATLRATARGSGCWQPTP